MEQVAVGRRTQEKTMFGCTSDVRMFVSPRGVGRAGSMMERKKREMMCRGDHRNVKSKLKN